ncbi:sex-determining protein fem-1 [Aspergillus luchuensis]|uniref:Sex-determining protein fem-1 n=1 Tax=Aspergillus kawachii TaxID=1069201 RepID=A0A146FWY8_ASPKA|nr:sex-determining protein fem-1 [Aspergillus luchuensis]
MLLDVLITQVSFTRRLEVVAIQLGPACSSYWGAGFLYCGQSAGTNKPCMTIYMVKNTIMSN